MLKELDVLVRTAEKMYREKEGPALDAARSGLELFLACRKEFGPEFIHWEPETLWLLHDFPANARDKILAVKTLATHPTMFTEPRGFAAIALTLGDLLPNLYELSPVAPELMAWATIEGELIFSLAQESAGEPVYGPDVTEFVAISLANDGYVVAPELLDFADDRLAAHLSPQGKATRAKVQKTWNAFSVDILDDLENYEFLENVDGVQLARLANVHVHCQRRVFELVTALH